MSVSCFLEQLQNNCKHLSFCHFLQLFWTGGIRIVVNHQLDWKATQFHFFFVCWTILLPAPVLCLRTCSMICSIFFLYAQHKVSGVEGLVKSLIWPMKIFCSGFAWIWNEAWAKQERNLFYYLRTKFGPGLVSQEREPHSPASSGHLITSTFGRIADKTMNI